MFSAVLKFIKTSCNHLPQQSQLLNIRRLTPAGAAELSATPSSTLHNSRDCSCSRLQLPNLTLANRKQERNRFYWNSIRKRFQSSDTTNGKSPSNKSKTGKPRTSGSNRMDEGRCWETTSTSVDEGEEIVVMSYNILAQHLLNVHQSLYAEHHRRHLAWDHRLNLIVRHIESISPQVLCLQEVQNTHLGELIKRLAGLGLDQHIFKKRTNPEYKDGCAIFYRSDCLELVDCHRVEFFQPCVKVSKWLLDVR